jgi:hypothetical protein
MPRTVISLKDHYDAVLASLNVITEFPIGEGERPKTSKGLLLDPPYAVLGTFPGVNLDGPISDTQADVELRFWVRSIGSINDECLVVTDFTRARMDRSLITVSSRKVRDVKMMTTTGIDRDDDLPTPIFVNTDIWILDTTPT